jgi:hypothetical protein
MDRRRQISWLWHKRGAWLGCSLAGSIPVLVALTLALPGLAAAKPHAPKPHAGCWGQCGGDRGPVGGYFILQDNKVETFTIEEKCLGTFKFAQPVGPPFIAGEDLGPIPNLKISRSEHFSYTGTTQRQTAKGERAVKVDLQGSFVTPSRVSISLAIAFGKCKTSHFTLRFA